MWHGMCMFVGAVVERADGLSVSNRLLWCCRCLLVEEL